MQLDQGYKSGSPMLFSPISDISTTPFQSNLRSDAYIRFHHRLKLCLIFPILLSDLLLFINMLVR